LFLVLSIEIIGLFELSVVQGFQIFAVPRLLHQLSETTTTSRTLRHPTRQQQQQQKKDKVQKSGSLTLLPFPSSFDCGCGGSRKKRSPAAVATQLSAFLPPSGEGGDGKKQELGELVKTTFTFLAVLAFFVSPLGGLFFALFNSLLTLVILLPVGAIVAFNVWQYLTTQIGPCPSCGAPVRVLKDESPSFCFNCGAIVQAKGNDNTIYLVNPNQGSILRDDSEAEQAAFGWWEDLTGVRTTGVYQQPPPSSSSKTTTIKTTIIDVDVEREE
jgi:hypothetical protein